MTTAPAQEPDGDWVAINRDRLVDHPAANVLGKVFRAAITIVPGLVPSLCCRRPRAAGERSARSRVPGAEFPAWILLNTSPIVEPLTGGCAVRISNRMRAQAVDVGAGIDQAVVGLDLLGGHVRGRADLADRRVRSSASAETEMSGSSAERSAVVGLADHLGQPPVEHDHLAVAPQHHVFGLEIAVDDAPRMRIADRLTDLDEWFEQLPLQLESIGGLPARRR